MIEAIIKDQERKTSEYLYLKKNNNILFYYGFCIDNNVIIPIDKNIIQRLYNLFRVNERCIYIDEYLNYKVYLDKENNIKHYIKAGIEDFEMLFKYNGEDATVYNLINNNQDHNINSKKFRIGKFIINVSVHLLILLSIYSITSPMIQALLYKGNAYNNFHYKFSKIAYSVSEYVDLDIKNIDSKQAIELIKNSNMPSDLKESLANEILLNDIFPYYENTDMEYLIKPKLENLKLRVYEPTEYFITDPRTTNGFYTHMAPNVINVKNTNKYKETAKHEFIHLLQEPDHKYLFLHEALAEKISEEYLDKKIDTYSFCVTNVSLLMDTIGPKIIWETVFSGDDTNLINVLKNNLNESEYNELISYLTSTPQETVENFQRINEIISNLYKNINKKEIREDKNIYDDKGYHIKRIYFNEDKMKKIQSNVNYIQINEIFPDQTIRQNKNLIK